MIDDKDVAKIISAMEEVFPKKDGLISAMEKIFPTKTDMDNRFDEVDKKFSDLQTSVDAYAKKADTYFQEMVMLSHKVDRMEKWLHEVAEKIGIELKY